MEPPRAGILSFGQPVHRYQVVASTQGVARQLAEDGAPEGAVVVAEEQSGGRGRLGKDFFSPPGGLYLSVVLRPDLRPSQAPLIGLTAGLVVAESVRALTGLAPVLKWPNDVLLNGGKVSGVLVDLSTAGDNIRWAILGIGVNVNVAQMAFPNELRTTATSLQHEMGRKLALGSVLAEVLARLESRYGQLCREGARPVLRSWQKAPNILGKIVRIADANEEFEGVAEDLDEDGALLVRVEDGSLRRVLAADVHLLRGPG